MRAFPLVALALCASLVSPAFAQEDQTGSQPGPSLQPTTSTPDACDPNASGLRYLEVRGSGFDAWSTQALEGSLVDASGAQQARWPSVWVTPQGQLTLEVNLCAQPISNRPALAPGDYTLSIGQKGGSLLAATDISLQGPAAEPSDNPEDQGPPPTPAPSGQRTGPGSPQQPYAIGTTANLVDGWRLAITNVVPDAYGQIKSVIPSAVAPSADQREVMLGLQATYTGSGTGTFTAVRLVLLNPTTGAQYDQLTGHCGAIPGSISPNVVTPGTVVLGNVCFTVPASEVGSVVAFDNQPSSADRVYFALH